MDVTINSSTPGKPLEVRFLKGSELDSSSLSSQAFDVQNPSSVLQVCNGSVSFVDDTSVTPPLRYFTGLFKFDNKLASSLTNLTFHAINTSSNPNGTAVLNIKTAGGTLLADPLIAQRMRPTHAMTVGSSGTTVNPSLAHLQAFTSLETLEVQNKFSAAFPTSSGKVLEYGYVAEKIGGGRTIAANDGTACDTGASSAQVAFSYAYPYQSGDTPSSLPFQFNLRFVLSVDSETTVTQSLEEQDGGAGAEGRGILLGATRVNTFPGTPYSGSIASRLLCNVRTAGTSNPALATLFPPTLELLGRSPAPNSESIPLDSRFVFDFVTLPSSADSTTLQLLSNMRSVLPATATTTGSSVTVTPLGPLLAGEVVDLSFIGTPNLCQPTARVRAKTKGDGVLGAFGRKQTVLAGATPQAVALGDLNGDNILDMVVANGFRSSTVTVRLGTGTGQFGSPQTLTTGDTPTSVALGDLDGDGVLDMVVTNRGANTVSVLLNDGSGRFSAFPKIIAGFGPTKVALGDLNGDGKLDVVVANQDSNTVSVRLGNGAGGFTTAPNVVAGGRPDWVVLGDLNSDGLLDMVASNPDLNQVLVRLGDGRGNFVVAPNVAVGVGPRVVALGDLNGDGRLDLVSINIRLLEKMLSVRLGDGKGHFTPAPDVALAEGSFDVVLGDVDGDGDLDALAVSRTGKLVTALNDSRGNFSLAPEIPINSQGFSMSLGDLDGDGALDAVVAHPINDSPGDGYVSVLLNTALNGNALKFGNSSASVSVPSNTALNGINGNYTLELWAKIPSSLSSTDNIVYNLLSKQDGDPAQAANANNPLPFKLFLKNGQLGALLCTPDPDASVCRATSVLSSLPQTLGDNKWHHLALVRQVRAGTQSLSVFVDGVGVASSSDAFSFSDQISNSAPLTLGADPFNPGFGGVLDEVRVWNVARAPTEIAQTLGRTFFSPFPASLLAYFKLDSVSGTNAINEITGGSSGTLLNFPTGNPWEVR